jgi:protein SCO1/2
MLPPQAVYSGKSSILVRPEIDQNLTVPFMSLLQRHWKLLACALLALVAGAWLSVSRFGTGQNERPPDIQGFFWPSQKTLLPFSMQSHRGDSFTLDDLQNRWSLMFFGYTYCPDICPVTMSVLRETLNHYKTAAPEALKELSVTFVSVDGERDTPEQLAAYIRFYDESWLAASGSKAEVDSLTAQIGIPYEIESHEPGEVDYLVAHSGSIYLISPQGNLAAIFHPPFDSGQLADQVLEIRRFMDDA